jgi:hypothetical protein
MDTLHVLQNMKLQHHPSCYAHHTTVFLADVCTALTRSRQNRAGRAVEVLSLRLENVNISACRLQRTAKRGNKTISAHPYFIHKQFDVHIEQKQLSSQYNTFPEFRRLDTAIAWTCLLVTQQHYSPSSTLKYLVMKDSQLMG